MSDLDKEAIITAVGPARYWRAAQAEQQAARYLGVIDADHRINLPLDQSIYPEIEDMIVDSALSDLRKMALFLDIYKDLPSYALLYVVAISWFDFGQEAHDLFWHTARDILDGENEAWARPLEYMLGVDFFEDGNLVDEAWAELVREDTTPQRLRRVLAASGPVPSPLREPLYMRLIGDSTWHIALLRSLVHSKEAYREPSDKERARRILQQLHVPADSSDLQEMRAFVQSS